MYKSMIRQVVQAYSGRIVKTYIYLRFKIINPTILEAMLSDFQPSRRALILGCGFGLFDLVLGLRWPEKAIRGIDINEGRLQAAREAAARLGLGNNAFEFMDLSRDDVRLGDCDEILLLDILHHVPPAAQADLVRKSFAALSEGGIMVVKDIHRAAPFKLFFTWALDMLMTKFEPVYYRHQQDFIALFEAAGFRVTTRHLNDLLPYPHILYICQKPRSA
jgi:2-polyprenyl-3-methyl-5-hydroxy-6-metoxy-1,4-benzoquinol methylase